jgi:hypothetical protein
MLNSAARLTLARIEGVLMLVRHIRSEIECFSMPLPSAFARCPHAVYEKCGYTRQSPPSSFSELIDGCAQLDGECLSILVRLADGLGKGYKDDQLALCDYYLELLEDRRAVLGSQLPMKMKRNGALCLCGALAVVILLI